MLFAMFFLYTIVSYISVSCTLEEDFLQMSKKSCVENVIKYYTIQ